MSNLLDSSTTWLAAQLENAAGRTITYTRTGLRVVLIATRIIEDEQAVDVTGSFILVRQHSYVFLFSSLGVEPRPGDRITETAGGTTTTWEVSPHAGGPPWQWEDAARIMARVYVTQVN